MKRARKVAADAHVLVCMIDATDEEEGFSAIQEVIDEDYGTNGQSILLLNNKVDLLDSTGTETTERVSSRTNPLDKLFANIEKYQISCETNAGVDNFIDVLSEKVLDRVSTSNDSDDDQIIEDDGTVITRARHRRHVMSASEALHRFQIRSGEGYMALDLAAEELRLAASELGRITGAVDVEDVLDVLFSDFCIGK